MSANAYISTPFPTEVDLDLSKNEGRPWPLSDTSLALDRRTVSRYPDITSLCQAVAARHGVGIERVLVTAGGDDALARCFLSRVGATVAVTNPGFEMIRRYAEQTGCQLAQVGWWDGDFPVNDFVDLAESSTMAVVVSPNNPTGSTITEPSLRRVAEAFRFVVLDAAYADFAEHDLTDAAMAFDNVVVIRTFSKAFGLAGLRVGYLLGSADAIGGISGFGSPYPVSGPSACLTEDALAADDQARQSYLAGIRSRREHLIRFTEELGSKPLPSQANFVLTTDVEPAWLVPAAGSLGVGLRAFPNEAVLARCVRITVPGTDRDLERLAATLRTVLAPEALLLDLDGVIADVSGSYVAAVIATAATFGVVVAGPDVAEAKADGNANDDWELTRTLCLARGVEVGLDDVARRFQELYEGNDEVPGLGEWERPLLEPETLGRWAERLPLAVVTGRPRREAERFLCRFGLADAFSTLVTREDGPLKPDPAPVRLAMEGLGVSHAWMVGDTADDISAARAAGVLPIGIVAPGDPPDIARRGLGGAALILDSITQIEEVLDAQKV